MIFSFFAMLNAERLQQHTPCSPVMLICHLGKGRLTAVAHIFDGYHVVRLEQLEAALAALGRRLVVSSEPT